MEKTHLGIILVVIVGFGLELSGIANRFARRRLLGIGPSQRLIIALSLVFVAAIVGW